MSDLPQNAWFHTRDGERIGPVTFAELRVLAREGQLNPRQDMVWTQGMAEWKPAGEIADLFDRRTNPEPPESLAPAADPYAPPKEESVAERMGRIGEWPGSRRRSYLAMTILFPFVWNLVFSKTVVFLTQQLGPQLMGVFGVCAAFLPLVVGIYFGLTRLVNLGMSRWWYLVNLLPVAIVIGWFGFHSFQVSALPPSEAWWLVSLVGVSLIPSLWVSYRCFACPAGYAFHKKIDGAGVALAILYWLLMLVTVIAIVVIAAVLLGAVNSPELQERLQEILRTARDQMK